ncbi:MAG: histidinol-phosphate transaminase [Phormidesmis sp.]
MTTRNRLFRPDINHMTGYQPGQWPALNAGVLKLNSNENPYPPSPKVLAALTDITGESLRRYPDPRAQEFCQTVSETFGIPADWVIAGNGSDDLLTMLVRACAEGHHRALAYPMPTYVLYRTLAAMQPAGTTEIPYAGTAHGQVWQLPVEKLLQTQAAVTLVASPNSPSGHIVPIDDLRSLAKGLSGVLAIDEAYVDFVGKDADQASLALVREFENVIVLRTLSKGYSLAGLRLGFGCAQPTLLQGLLKVKDSYNVDAVALRLGAAAIADQSYKDDCVEKNAIARKHLVTNLEALGFLVWPSHTNFLLVQPPGKTPVATAWALCEGLKARKILIRYFNQPGLDDKLRITVGTLEQNERLVSAIKELL